MSKKYIFHHDDLDGISSMYFIKRFTGIFDDISCNYENKINPLSIINKDDYMILVDYSFDPETMKKIYKLLGDNFIWIDHHISAINNSKKYGYDNIKGIRDINYCGVELSYIYYQQSKEIPLLIKEIGNFDMFRTFGTDQFYTTLCIFYGCTAYKDSLMEAMKKIVIYGKDKEYYDYFKRAGASIYTYEFIKYKEDCTKYSYVRNIWNKRVLCMNTSEGGLGLQLTKVFDPEKHDMILTYNFNGKHWCYGFYTDKNKHPEVNCAEIAELYGGGGHKSAAGATLDYIFQELIEDNK
jgi:oligoribonuclease NrnB/cAMP/cGMP phosphodiesterase (DHH superfamily)